MSDYLPAGVTDQDPIFQESGFEQWLEEDYHTKTFEDYASDDCEDNLGGEAIAIIQTEFQSHGGFGVQNNPYRKHYLILYELWEESEQGHQRLLEEWERNG